MVMNDPNSTERPRAQTRLFSLWMALAALMVIITMAAGLATSSHASEIVDPMTTSSIATAPISRASDRILVIGLVVIGFVTMAVGGIALTVNGIRDSSPRKRGD